MSRKDYVAIASKLAWSYRFADGMDDEPSRAIARRAIDAAVFGIADAFAEDNARFDRSRFLAAAGMVQS